jgi:superfamily II DNA/RNA helicase
LHSLGFKATYYHGGLTSREKDKNMQLWMDDKAQVIVATNAFEWALTKQMSRPLFTSNFQKTSKIIIKKQVDLAEMEKSIWWF